MVRAAGAVLWRPGPDHAAGGVFASSAASSSGAAAGESSQGNAQGPQVALVHRPKYDDWTFPKGKLKRGEHVLRGAVREVAEETGFTPRLGRRLRPAFYLADGQPKRVDYWAAATSAEAEDRFVPTDEVDRLEWSTVEAAERRLSYPRDVGLLHELTGGPLRTTPYILLRHGSAGEKQQWLEDDALRPLDARGRAEAGRLAGLLTCFGALRVISSCTARCAETVLPYALRAGADVVTDRAFTVDLTTPRGAVDRMGGLIMEGDPTVVCTHGELLTGLIPELCARLDGKPPDEPALGKGDFWVLHVAHGTLAALERHSA